NVATGQANPVANGPANTASLASWLFQRGVTTYDTELFVADAQISGGTGITLPGGEIQFGVGGQYRKNWFETSLGATGDLRVNPCRETPLNGNTNAAACAPNPGSVAPAAANGAYGFLGTGLPVSVNQDIYALFGEVQIPIFDTLNFQGAARYEDYRGGIGSTFNPQGRLRWQVTPWLKMRGGIGTTFRGPTAANTTNNRVTTLQLIGSTFTPTDTFGNPALKPEKSTNYSGGVIVKFGGLQASIDYFRYRLTDSIVTDPLSSIVATLFPTGQPNTCAANPALAARFTYTTAGCTAASTTANIARATLLLQNGPTVQNSGLDIIVNYRARNLFNTSLRAGAGVTATYTIENKIGAVVVEGKQVSAPYDGVGLLNYQKTLYPLPQWKGQAYVDFGGGPADARLTVNYSDGLHDQRFDDKSGPFAPNVNIAGAPTLTQGADINEFVTADLNLSITVMKRFTVTGTVFNIFDAQPPFAREDYDYEPFVGNAYGRMFKLAVSTRF
ncbi:MAG: TonB-dependent receptor, partial [Proteobacteria bacterium]